MALRTRQHAAQASTKHRFFINRAFGLLWSGQTVSELGSHITGSAIPFIAILVLGASPVQAGLLAALSALPSLLFSLPIGVWVDRLPRRTLLMLSDLVRAILLLSLPIAALGGLLRMEQLYIVVLLLGTCTICFDTTYRAFLPQVVAPEQLVEGNSKLGTSSSLAEMGGPPLAGGLVQLIGAPLAVLFDAFSFLVSALSIGLIRPREIQPIVPTEKREHIWREMSDGMRALFGHPLLRVLAIHATVWTFCGGAFAALYTIYVVRELRITPMLYGLLIAAGGLGALVGSLITPHLVRRFGAKRVLLYGALTHGVTSWLTPLAGGSASLSFGLLALAQLGDVGYALYAINEISLRQDSVPGHLQGRVNAAVRFMVGGVGPVGTLLAGIVSEWVGVRLTLLCGACGISLITAWLVFALRRWSDSR